MTTLSVVFMCLYAVCEVLAAIPSIKANSVFQLIMLIFKTLAGSGNPPTPPQTPAEAKINVIQDTAKQRQEAEESGRPS